MKIRLLNLSNEALERSREFAKKKEGDIVVIIPKEEELNMKEKKCISTM